MSNRIISIAAINAFIAIAAGAFAAHGLKHYLDADNLAIFHTAAYYQMVHALGLLFIGLLNKIEPQRKLNIIAKFMFVGIILFSGSLYALALTQVKWLGFITPIGGLCFLIAWFYLAIIFIKQTDSSSTS